MEPLIPETAEEPSSLHDSRRFEAFWLARLGYWKETLVKCSDRSTDVMDVLEQILNYGFFEKGTIDHKGQRYDTLDLLGSMLSQVLGGRKTKSGGYALRVMS